MQIKADREIRLLPENLVNRIAAGEVLERPASAVKELVENSIDAGATQINIIIEAGGKNLIRIIDDGIGMTQPELELAIQRHATSKIKDNDLLELDFFGFRGEALPSIASVSRMEISSIKKGENEGNKIILEGGEIKSKEPSPIISGTVIEIRDLFYATPARLKFLKTDRTENHNISDIIKKLAMANPSIGFNLIFDDKKAISYQAETGDFLPALQRRLQKILGQDFIQNSIEINNQRDNNTIQGFCGLPTYNRSVADWQFFFVNGRAVRDKIFYSSLKIAYKDFLGHGRQPCAVLFLNTPKQNVDVNVHPAKAEVRFRFESEIRSLLIGSVKEAISSAGHRASTETADYALSKFNTPNKNTNTNYGGYTKPKQDGFANLVAYKNMITKAVD